MAVFLFFVAVALQLAITIPAAASEALLPRHVVCSPVVNVYSTPEKSAANERRGTDFHHRESRKQKSNQADEPNTQKIKRDLHEKSDNEIVKLTEEKIEETRNKVSQLEDEIQALRVKLGELSSAKSQVVEKPTRPGNERVAFASQLGSPFGPTQDSRPAIIPYDRVTVNDGNGYNETGVFTCPVNGVYFFQFHATKGEQYEAHVKLMKNGVPILAAHSRGQKYQIQETSNSVILPLKEGDKIWTVLGAQNGVPYQVLSHPVHRYTTFSGFLLWTG